MFSKALIVGTVALFGLTACASASQTKLATRTTYVGGHDPGRNTQVVSVPDTATPYTLTGNTVQARRYEPIRIGSRIVGQQVVQE